MPKFNEGDLISVRYGAGPRTIAVVIDGPHDFTAWEMKQNIAAKEKAGHKTDRMPKTYYRAKVGNKVIRALGGHIHRAEAHGITELPTA